MRPSDELAEESVVACNVELLEGPARPDQFADFHSAQSLLQSLEEMNREMEQHIGELQLESPSAFVPTPDGRGFLLNVRLFFVWRRVRAAAAAAAAAP